MQINPKPTDRYENLILALTEQYAGVPQVRSYPFSLMLDPSSICNLKCPCCISSLPDPVRTKTLMTMELYKKIIDEIGPYLFELDLFNWGEPFLNKALPEMLAYAKQYPLEILMSTNFSISINDEMAKAILDHVDRLFVSLDGVTQESYEKYRVGGKLDLALGNLKKLAAMKKACGQEKPLIEWQFLVFAFNEHEFKQAEAMAYELGVKFRPLAPYVPEPTKEWLSSIPAYVHPQYRQPVNTATSLPNNPLEPIANRIWQLAHTRLNRCDWHYLRTSINANGTVSPCCGIQHESQDFGDLKQESFHEIWNNQLFQAVRQHFNGNYNNSTRAVNPPVCFNCQLPEEQTHCHLSLQNILQTFQALDPVTKNDIIEVLPPHLKAQVP